MESLEKNNPLAQMNPISQANLMKSNIEEIKNNLAETIELLKTITGNINLTGSPCEIAKFVTNKVCTMNRDFGDLSGILSFMSLDKIKELANNSLNISKNLVNQTINGENINKKISALVNNTSNMAKTIKSMKGGSYEKHSDYKYIINPRTGRKVLANGKIGKKVILNYINNIN